MENNSDKTLYEVGYLLVPIISEEKLPDEVGALRQILEGNGGFIVAEGQPKMMRLAYEIAQKGVSSKRTKYNDAYFGWVKFETLPEFAPIIDEALSKSDKVLRHLIIKTTKDSGKPTRLFVAKPKEGEAVPGVAVEAAVVPAADAPKMAAAEIDKEIEGLLDGTAKK